MDLEASQILSTTSGGNLLWIGIGCVLGALIALVAYIIMERADTRPVKQGFYGGKIHDNMNITCGIMSKDADNLFTIFSSVKLNRTEEGNMDFYALKNLLGKLCCFKNDLMSPNQMILAVKDTDFVTQQDIQPIGDLTGRCFSKTISDRDLSLQFIKWREVGNNLIHRLCTSANLSESEVIRAEKLFINLWEDVKNIATSKCLAVLPEEKKYRFDATPMETQDVSNLKKYDGLY